MNNQTAEFIDNKAFTFQHWSRLVFVIFCLYFMGDVFYRWDAFKFHSTFSAYLPNVALALILWSIIALLSLVLSWLPIKAFQVSCNYLGLKIKLEHLILYLSIFVLVSGLAWVSKKSIWHDIQTTTQLKLTVIALISGASIPLTWLLRNKAEVWVKAILERITPLVWLFAICLLLSLLLVGFHIWGNNSNSVSPKVISKLSALDSEKKRPNILLLTFDAFSARHMSVYGYNRETTPFMKKWAESASLFMRTNAESSYTGATTPSLMTGKRTWTHRKYHHDIGAKPLKSETENIALILKEKGYFNSAFIVNDLASVKALGISNSIDIAPSVVEFTNPRSIEGFIEKYLYLLFGDNFSTYNWIGQDDFIFTILLRRIDKNVFTTEFPVELAFNKFLEVIDNNSHEPFFAWIHVLPPHAPYSPLEPFAETFNPSWEMREKNDMYRYNPQINRLHAENLPFPNQLIEKIKLLRDYYDEFILYCDNQFENFIGELKKRNVLDDTVIIISADHGESFYEHDYFQHGSPHLYEQVTHIPLIIKEPDQTEGRIIDDIVEQVDIPATILSLVDIPVPSWMEGSSLLPLLRDKKLPAKTAISASLYMNNTAEPITSTGTIAVWQNDYKLIHYLDNEKSLLFNLKKDPDELDNLVTKEPETAERLLAVIKKNLNAANKRIIEGK